jgi:hypothetical protein
MEAMHIYAKGGKHMNCKRCGKQMRLKEIQDELYYVCDDCRIKVRAPESEYESADTLSKTPAKKKLNTCLLIALILGVAYLVYSAVYWSGAFSSSTSAAEQAGVGIATALVMPHLVASVLAVIFNALGLFMNKRGFALTGAILYTVAIALFPLYFMYVIIQMILSYIGFAKLKSQ